MAAPSVSDSAITTSLLFAIGLGRNLDPESVPLAQELQDSVTQMLRDQGAAEKIAQALDTVQAGRDAVTSDPSLSLSAQKYAQLRAQFLNTQGTAPGRGRNVWPVGASTILKRASGSWSAALQNVGLSASSRARPSGFGSARFTEEQFRAALRDFTVTGGQAGFTTSYQSYVDWRKLQQQQGRSDLPSGPSIRNTYGSWSAALEREGEQPGGAEAQES